MLSCISMCQNLTAVSGLGDPDNLDKQGPLFVIQLKETNGSNYETSSMCYSMSLLDWNVQEIGKGNVEKDGECRGLRDVNKSA